MDPFDKSTIRHDIQKKQVSFKLQGLLLNALMDMSRDRQEEIPQVIKDILEQRLVKDGYLPEWWFHRGDRHI